MTEQLGLCEVFGFITIKHCCNINNLQGDTILQAMLIYTSFLRLILDGTTVLIPAAALSLVILSHIVPFWNQKTKWNLNSSKTFVYVFQTSVSIADLSIKT